MRIVFLFLLFLTFIFSSQSKKEGNKNNNIKKIKIDSFFVFRFKIGKQQHKLYYDNSIVTNIYFYKNEGNQKGGNQEEGVLFFKSIALGDGKITIQNELISNFYHVKIIAKQQQIAKNVNFKKEIEKQSFDRGQKLFNQKKYDNALPYLISFYQKNQNLFSENMEVCLFFLGNIFLNYPNFSPSEAKKYFSILLKNYPQGYYFHEAKKKIDYINYKFY